MASEKQKALIAANVNFDITVSAASYGMDSSGKFPLVAFQANVKLFEEAKNDKNPGMMVVKKSVQAISVIDRSLDNIEMAQAIEIAQNAAIDKAIDLLGF